MVLYAGPFERKSRAMNGIALTVMGFECQEIQEVPMDDGKQQPDRDEINAMETELLKLDATFAEAFGVPAEKITKSRHHFMTTGDYVDPANF